MCVSCCYIITSFDVCLRDTKINYLYFFFSLIKEKSTDIDELNCYSDTEILASVETDLNLAKSKLSLLLLIKVLFEIIRFLVLL